MGRPPLVLLRMASALVASSLVCVALPARAQDTTAEAIFDEGLELFEAGDYAAACPKLKSAVALSSSEPIGGKLLLAECYEKQRKWASAWALYRELVPKAAALGQTARRDKAEDGRVRVEAKLPRLTIEPSPEVARLAGLSIDRDGEPIPPEAWGVALPVDPGDSVITATAPGKRAHQQSVRIEDAPTTSTIRIEHLDDDAVAGPAPAGSPSAPAETPRDPGPSAPNGEGLSGLGVGGIVIGATGLVAMGVSVILAASAKSSWDTAFAEQSDTGIADARGTGNVATGAFVAGAIFGAVGATLLVVDLTSEASPSPTARLRVRSAGLGAFAEGTF